MSDSDPAGRPTKRIGGRLCLDFVNTVAAWEPYGPPTARRFAAVDERVTDFAGLLAWSAPALEPALLRRIGEAARRRPGDARRVWRRALGLREALYRLYRAQIAGSAPDAGDLALLEDEWRKARAGERLERRHRGFAVSAAPPAASGAAGELLGHPLHEIARSAVELLTSAELPRVRYCPGEHCGWLFLDTSRNGRRRWCDMNDCGNLDKVRRFRARRRDESAPTGAA